MPPYNSSSTAADEECPAKRRRLRQLLCCHFSDVGRCVLLTTSLEVLKVGVREVPSCRSAHGRTVTHRILLYLKCWGKNR